MIVCCFITTFLALMSAVTASEYKNGSKVDIYVNKVGPFFNPHETYHYYQLPVCRPEKIEPKSLTLGEVLDGDRMAMSLYDVHFKEEVNNRVLCKQTLSAENLVQLRDAIEDLYYFEFVIDEIPVRGFVGRLDESGFLPHSHSIYLWTHLVFNIEYNGQQIIYANVSTKESKPFSLTEVVAPVDITFTYSVRWIPTSMKYADRAQRVRDNTFFPKTLEVHWLSIINSMILVFLLIMFVLIILARVVKNDFSRYNVSGSADDDGDDTDDEGEDYGWKLIHGDVFRFPPYPSLFCAVLGVGTQFLAIATGVLLMALFGMFGVHHHGAIDIAVIVLYALTSCISGFVSTNMYQKMGGENWLTSVNLTSALFTLPFVVVWAVVNTVAWMYGSTQALPWGTVILLLTLWAVLGYPLTVVGAMFGRSIGGTFDAPSRTKPVPREIPSVAWYRTPLLHCAVGGFLPFSAISVELYYIFATLWGREQFTLYGILFIVYVILLSVTACIAVALTYFQLSAEDHRWWWRSIFSAGSSSVFVFFYALFYYTKRSNMSGILQMTEFFGYTLLACYAFCLMLGAVSFFVSLRFVRYIYVNVKVD